MGCSCSTESEDDEREFYPQGTSRHRGQNENNPSSAGSRVHIISPYSPGASRPAPSPFHESFVPRPRLSTSTTVTTLSSRTTISPQPIFINDLITPRPATRPSAKPVAPVHVKPSATSRWSDARSCQACGDPDHSKSDCRYRDRLCFNCRQEGHIIRICPAKQRNQKQSNNRGKGGPKGKKVRTRRH
ncbi:uncharacterized protein LOC129756928 [Uranotaenia lowii]|uniref:uncharacterized protein LOC129756928 n=1 Tax=Uranotaenia lowii TaxID=190385 RepID=UPI002478CC46|nr:uncharacterized protein LOC129756928 [Uranotaenia lowii]